ncbi:MAG: type VII secretion target [Micromonosporaceae bacterium]
MPAETVYVDPEFLRVAGSNLEDVAADVAQDAKAAKNLEPSDKLAGPWVALNTTVTVGRLWHTYLSGISDDIAGYGQRLGRAADAYQTCDEEAAKRLGIELPADGPVVKDRPGHVPE